MEGQEECMLKGQCCDVCGCYFVQNREVYEHVHPAVAPGRKALTAHMHIIGVLLSRPEVSSFGCLKKSW